VKQEKIMDHKEEQNNEIETLQSIYMENLTISSTDPYIFSLNIFPYSTETEEEINYGKKKK
jgi:cobalamin-dependent methionine synthase I